MKNIKFKIVVIMVILMLAMILPVVNNVQAASFSVSAKTQNLQPNGTTQLVISTSGCAGKFNIKTSDSSIVSLSASSTFVDGSSMEPSITLTAKRDGTATITVETYDVLDTAYNEIKDSKQVKITVKTPTNPGGQTGGNNGGSTGGNNGGSTTTVTEPKFTSANKTVYANTDNLNLRSSWSTSSSATRVAKGTELKLTGTSTQKVNGYVWYRVTYNGQTKYVSRDLITETKPEEKEEKSNNTNLQTLAIQGVELTPTFSADVTEYSVKLVNYKEQSLKINAEAEDSKSTVKVEGNEEIKIGENVISITVTAEDGKTKVYKVTVTNEEKEGLGLSSLVIKGVELKNFSPSKFNYEIEFSKLDQLEIEAIANEEGATVEIIGNENLTEVGEHVITIMVTSSDGEQIATYTITANKVAVEEAKQELNIKSILICALIALVVLVAIIILIVKYLKGNNSAEVEYVYNDNLENKDENDIETKEEIEQNNEIETEKEEVKEAKQVEEKNKKPTVDDLYADYDDEPVKKRGKGRHSK